MLVFLCASVRATPLLPGLRFGASGFLGFVSSLWGGGTVFSVFAPGFAAVLFRGVCGGVGHRLTSLLGGLVWCRCAFCLCCYGPRLACLLWCFRVFSLIRVHGRCYFRDAPLLRRWGFLHGRLRLRRLGGFLCCRLYWSERVLCMGSGLFLYLYCSFRCVLLMGCLALWLGCGLRRRRLVVRCRVLAIVLGLYLRRVR